MKNLFFFFIGLITLFASCTPDTIETIEPVEYDVDIPFNPNAENDLPSDTGGFIGGVSVGDGFNIKLDTMINDLPSDVGGFNPVIISDFQTTQINDYLQVSFDAVDDLTDKYVFIAYSLERFQSVGGFMLRGGAESYNYNLQGLPSEELCVLYGFKNNDYLGGVYVYINSNN